MQSRNPLTAGEWLKDTGFDLTKDCIYDGRNPLTAGEWLKALGPEVVIKTM